MFLLFTGSKFLQRFRVISSLFIYQPNNFVKRNRKLLNWRLNCAGSSVNCVAVVVINFKKCQQLLFPDASLP